jgi:hypothetical protein
MPFEDRGSGSHFAILSRHQPAALKVATHPGESSPAIPDSSRMRLCDKTAPIGLAAPFD